MWLLCKKLKAGRHASVAQLGQEAEGWESWEVLNMSGHFIPSAGAYRVSRGCQTLGKQSQKHVVLLHLELTFPRGVLPAQWEHQQMGVEGATPGVREDQTCAWGLGDAAVEAGRCSRWRPLQGQRLGGVES